MPMLLTPKEQSNPRKPNVITLISMAKRNQVPKICDLYINMTKVMVDDFYENWRTGSDTGRGNVTGMEPYVQNTIQAIYGEFFDSLVQVIVGMADKQSLLDSGLVIMLSCSEGQRRSVASVEILARLLRDLDYICEVHHLELEKWLTF